jgi:hypothetical protein
MNSVSFQRSINRFGIKDYLGKKYKKIKSLGLLINMGKQKRHVRTSKKGKRFYAGRGVQEPPVLRRKIDRVSRYSILKRAYNELPRHIIAIPLKEGFEVIKIESFWKRVELASIETLLNNFDYEIEVEESHGRFLQVVAEELGQRFGLVSIIHDEPDLVGLIVPKIFVDVTKAAFPQLLMKILPAAKLVGLLLPLLA